MIEFWPYLVAFKATVPKNLCYNPLDIFWSKVFHICVDNPTKFPDRLDKLFDFRPTLMRQQGLLAGGKIGQCFAQSALQYQREY